MDVLISPENIPDGVTSGRIIIENVYQTIEIEINLSKPTEKEIKVSKSGSKTHLIKSNQVRLITTYMDYRMGRIQLREYISTTLFAFNNLARYVPEEDLYRLGTMHMNIMQGETEKVEQEFLRIEADVDNSGMNNKQSCYYAYLKAMVGKDRRATEQAKELIRRSYHTEDDKIFYFWLLLFVDDTYNNDQTALYREVKNLYEQGYNSPLMYMELCEVLNNNPLLLKHITDLEVTTIRWGLRHQYLSDEVIEAFIQLAASFRQFDAKIFEIMDSIYSKKKSDEVLSSICSMLISAGNWITSTIGSTGMQWNAT